MKMNLMHLIGEKVKTFRKEKEELKEKEQGLQKLYDEVYRIRNYYTENITYSDNFKSAIFQSFQLILDQVKKVDPKEIESIENIRKIIFDAIVHQISIPLVKYLLGKRPYTAIDDALIESAIKSLPCTNPYVVKHLVLYLHDLCTSVVIKDEDIDCVDGLISLFSIISSKLTKDSTELDVMLAMEVSW